MNPACEWLVAHPTEFKDLWGLIPYAISFCTVLLIFARLKPVVSSSNPCYWCGFYYLTQYNE